MTSFLITSQYVFNIFKEYKHNPYIKIESKVNKISDELKLLNRTGMFNKVYDIIKYKNVKLIIKSIMNTKIIDNFKDMIIIQDSLDKNKEIYDMYLKMYYDDYIKLIENKTKLKDLINSNNINFSTYIMDINSQKFKLKNYDFMIKHKDNILNCDVNIGNEYCNNLYIKYYYVFKDFILMDKNFASKDEDKLYLKTFINNILFNIDIEQEHKEIVMFDDNMNKNIKNQSKDVEKTTRYLFLIGKIQILTLEIKKILIILQYYLKHKTNQKKIMCCIYKKIIKDIYKFKVDYKSIDLYPNKLSLDHTILIYNSLIFQSRLYALRCFEFIFNVESLNEFENIKIIFKYPDIQYIKIIE